jgi:hypothetical protein
LDTACIMGELIDRLEMLSVRASSPDGGIEGTVRGRLDVDIRFVHDAYRRYSERDLGHQLAQLGALLWTRYRREYLETATAVRAGDNPIIDDEPRDLAFRERMEALVVHGRSAHGWISMRSRALVHWDVKVGADAIRQLSEDEFLVELSGAIADILRDWQGKLIVLTDEIYDIGVPASLRRAAADRGR